MRHSVEQGTPVVAGVEDRALAASSPLYAAAWLDGGTEATGTPAIEHAGTPRDTLLVADPRTRQPRHLTLSRSDRRRPRGTGTAARHRRSLARRI
jgi:hypothetical protein